MIARIAGVLWLCILSGCAVEQPGSTLPERWYPPTNDRGDPIFAVFEGRIPCTDSKLSGCDKIKVALALYRDTKSQAPTTYKLARVYVATSPEGARSVVDGAWTVTRGMKLNPGAAVYRLDAGAPPEFRAYWSIGEDILFVLDKDMSPRVGTAGWSYVLNRTQ
jgi:hypothetical protein